MEGYARRIAVAGTKAVPRMQQHTPPPPKKIPRQRHTALPGETSQQATSTPDPGRPYSPSSYTTLPAQMVYFTFP